MKLVTLYTDADLNSYFKESDIPAVSIQPLGKYSSVFPCSGFKCRTFKKGACYAWHNAPQPQYIIYLEGIVEIEASGGEIRVFKPGDILFATDTSGKGHITRTLSNGRSIIITTL